MRATIWFLVLAAVTLAIIAYLRPPEYDESYSIFLTAGHARPAWPVGPFRPAQVRGFYAGSASFARVAVDLRGGDVHPPVYFWVLDLWRGVVGPDWFAARLLSVMFALGALAVLARLAGLTATPVLPALLLCLTSYGFAYTAVIARGFALANLLLLVGVMLCAPRPGARGAAVRLVLGGLAFGAATLTNYLTLFVALAGLGDLLLRLRLRAIPAILAFALFLPADFWFFAAQRASRPHQFAPFSLARALALLAKDSAAAWFGGLPLYAGRFAPIVAGGLILIAALTLFFVARRAGAARKPIMALALATPVGLVLLGLVFNNTPIEIRYLAFSLPYLALLIAASAPRALQAGLLALQSCALVGLAISPLTAQPQQAAAWQAVALAAPGTLTLVPFGNDGVGIPGPFVRAAPDNLTLQLLRPGAPPDLTGPSRLILATLALDDSSRAALAQTQAALQSSPCWQQQTTTRLVRLYLNRCAPH